LARTALAMTKVAVIQGNSVRRASILDCQDGANVGRIAFTRGNPSCAAARTAFTVVFRAPRPNSSLAPPVNDNASAADRENAFDLIRLLLAVLVVYSHAHLVGGFGEEGFTSLCKMQTNSGPLAVTAFFGISGFLVTRSYATRGNWLQFVRARLLRILPGLYFALAVTAFCLAPLIAHLNPAAGPWTGGAAFRYLWDNALVRNLEPRVGDVLHGLPFAESINGSLWTLFPELCCYGLILVLGLAGWYRSGRANVLLACACVLALHAAIVVGPANMIIAPTFLQLTGWSPHVAAFVSGSAIYCYRDSLEFGGRSWAVWLGVVLVLLNFGGWALLGPAALTVALIQMAYSFRVRLPFDLSYGTFLLHFPVLQLLAAGGLHQHGFVPYFSAALVATLALAALSWYVVERPFLRLK
jgi:peptidoglycan/LPS O-acetylase OafA/YrhL